MLLNTRKGFLSPPLTKGGFREPLNTIIGGPKSAVLIKLSPLYRKGVWGIGNTLLNTTKGGPKSSFCCVELPGLEPRTTEPKSAVLPLHHSSIRCS